MKHIDSFPAALTAIALALAAGSADAQVVNGDFSHGTTGWTLGGDGAVVGGHLSLTNAYPDGSDDNGLALNLTGNAPLTGGVPGGLEDSAGLPAFALDPDTAAGITAVEGSVASQTFTTAAGSTLSFSWNLATMDTSGVPSLADIAFVVVDGKLTVLGNVLGATSPADPGSSFAAQTGWASWSTLLASGGAHTVAFGVADIGDFAASSALNVGSVSVSAVPESSGIAMLAAGLGLLALQARRRRDR
jgi:hypothetical protein